MLLSKPVIRIPLIAILTIFHGTKLTHSATPESLHPIVEIEDS